jgi:hypothetical protein
MHGNLKVYEHQKLIKHFNNANSEIKVLIASTRTCFEGINLFNALRKLQQPQLFGFKFPCNFLFNNVKNEEFFL